MGDQKLPEKSIVAAAPPPMEAETGGFKPFMEVIPPHMFMDPQRGTRGFEIGVRWNYENPTGDDHHDHHHGGYGPRSMPPQRSLGPFRPPPMMMGYGWHQPPPRYMVAPPPPPPPMHHRYGGYGGSPYHHHQHAANYNYYGGYEYEYEYPGYGQHAAYYGGYYY